MSTQQTSVSAYGCEATYPYYEKEFTNGIILLNNFPRLKYSTHALHTISPSARMSPDITGFWIDYFANNDPSRPGYMEGLKDQDLAVRVFMSMNTVSRIAKAVFPFTIGADKQAGLNIGAFYPVRKSITCEDGRITDTDLEQKEVFDFDNDIRLEDFVPSEWIQYELAIRGHSSNWLHHWVYNLDDTYQPEPIKPVFGIAVNEMNKEFAYNYLSKHIYLRVVLQRWLYTFVSTYLYASLAPLRLIKEKAEKGDGSQTFPDEIHNVEAVVRARQQLTELITRMSSFWTFKGDSRVNYGTVVDTINSEYQLAVLMSIR
jgi:hypothetical protein